MITRTFPLAQWQTTKAKRALARRPVFTWHMNWRPIGGTAVLCLTAVIQTLAAGRNVPGHDAGTERELAGRTAAVFPTEDIEFLRRMTRDVVQAARVAPGERRGNSPTNSVGFTLICPGGHYPAYWIRDFAMALESGFITPDEMLNHLRLTAREQNGPVVRRLANGLVVPPYAIPDHINFDGGAVFYPGTMSSGNDQGNGAFGILPPVDDHYEFVHIAHQYYVSNGSTHFLREKIGEMRLFDRLIAAFHAPRVDSETGLVETGDADRAVGFGFYDTVQMTGKLLFPSVLRHEAAGQLAELSAALGDTERVASFRRIQQTIAANLAPTFGVGPGLEGWLRASTGACAQADVWGTLYALHRRVLPASSAAAAERAILKAVKGGTITYLAAVRHVPINLDFSEQSAWERTAGVAVNTYQNGAFWHTPTGWLITVAARSDPALALDLFEQFLRHLREQDYRLGNGRQAPWECLGPTGYKQNGVYMTSVALPLALFVPADQQMGR
ncbi:MAG: hypothetical protein AB9869_32125 [Verrucomicrobiia bacterium]